MSILVLTSYTNYKKRNISKNENILQLSDKILKDKIKGGWAGQVIGVTYGGPYEFSFLGTYIQDYKKFFYQPGTIKQNMIHNPGLYDDLYMDIIFANVIYKYGILVCADSFARPFANADFKLWHANQSARYNILNGINPPASGYYKNNPHADDIDFQIESDFAGLMCPGMPHAAAKLDDKVGHIMCYGDGWYGGVFISTMYTLAFTELSLNNIVKTALKSVPNKSNFYKCISDVIRWHDMYPDWHDTWFELQKKWAEDVGCPDGVFNPFDIDAKINAAYVVIGLLYGNGNFDKSIEIATRCGQDADCNPSTVAGILGTVLGYDKIPERWKKEIQEVEEIPFSNTSLSLSDAYKISYKNAVNTILENGGKIKNNLYEIRKQNVVAVKQEESFSNLYPKEMISLSVPMLKDTIFSFSGEGIVIRGSTSQINQSSYDYAFRIQVEYDKKKADTILLPVSFIKRRNEIYWNYELSSGKHNIRIRVLNPSKDYAVSLTDYILYSRNK
ncbi:MAG: ADP-ribosylglycohydrolase family protein [Arachidicoccus sp.]|nr:ADP-ribosylglycohydrolase family protein [Arachidicoccus sp.]